MQATEGTGESIMLKASFYIFCCIRRFLAFKTCLVVIDSSAFHGAYCMLSKFQFLSPPPIGIVGGVMFLGCAYL